MGYVKLCALILMAGFCISSVGQSKTDSPEDSTKPGKKGLATSTVPGNISRTIKQDRDGNIWIAAFDGVFRYDGKSFANITSKVSSGRFFSMLEDRKGNFWFGSIGSGVYYYDGTSFTNFTTRWGLPNNEVVCIYEDKAGNIWFGVNGGVSCYDGASFRNFIISGDSMTEDRTRRTIPDFTRPPQEVNSIVEDKTGRIWLATRGNTFIFDGRTFTTVSHRGKPFKNVRWIMEDRKGKIWLGGGDGLWRNEGNLFFNVTKNFVGYIYEDRNGNIWTSSDSGSEWLLSRYDAKTLYSETPTVTEIKSGKKGNEGMIFGILEARDGSIWFGALDGVYRYERDKITGFKGEEVSHE